MVQRQWQTPQQRVNNSSNSQPEMARSDHFFLRKLMIYYEKKGVSTLKMDTN